MLSIAWLLLLAPPLPPQVTQGDPSASTAPSVSVGALDCETIRRAQFPEIPPERFVAVGDGCGPRMPERPQP